MPLHLLSKKSWNVYAPDNIARVKRDQAEAQAREEEADRQLQEHDSARRLAVLRGEQPASQAEQDARAGGRRRTGERHGEVEDRRKRRRLYGEDDTDRELRLAQENMASPHRRRDDETGRDRKRKRSDAPIVDRDGHINLFPVDHRVSAREQRNVEVEDEKVRKKRELEDQYTMRLSNAAGKDGLKQEPWYASEKRHKQENMDFIEGKDVWGRPDPAANNREQTRQSASDPFAFMQRAQSQLKQAEMDRQRWQQEEQAKFIAPNKHGERHRRARSKERTLQSTKRRRHENQGTKGEYKTRRQRREHESEGRCLKDDMRYGQRTDKRKSFSDIPNDFHI